ncbi:MAG: 3-oxoacyl-ACP reductase FabG [Candidatus Eremiobacteraeota bacterium]|nr:3-oxoacyl-ACP reductase FabG [Candidatus Eremiobacteraeota bacterium]MBC5828377.1 3-oxoacyl-ACP reductase FabG [Candidatus Eremiobacteraeota bacterium]
MNTGSLAGRVGIVTGGASGIGAAITSTLVNDGAKVAILGLAPDRERSQRLLAGLNGGATAISFHEVDVAQFDACQDAAQTITHDLGRIDFLINSAGIVADRTVRKMSLREWETVLRVNLFGPFFMIKAVLEGMVQRNYGRIVNISSVIGHTGNIGQANYAAAKAGLFGLTKSVALEMANRGVTVNCVAPGFIDTELVGAMPTAAVESAIQRTPEHRLGKPDEVARVVRFLLDDNAGYITGAVYDVNGGFYM